MMTKIIQIDDSLRLVPYFLADHHDAALGWYQDVDLVELVDGIRIPYSLEKLNTMYSYLESNGDLFWILKIVSYLKMSMKQNGTTGVMVLIKQRLSY